MANSLVVDFHGPIAFRFAADFAWAFIPVCDYHTCNVLSDSHDISPEERKTFYLTEPMGATQTRIPRDGNGKAIGAEPILLKWSVTKLGDASPNEQQCYCIFRLPLPDYLYGLRKEYVYIENSGIVICDDDFARGYRFYYNQCNNPPKITPKTTSKTTFNDFDPRYLQPEATYRIEIRYHDINPLQARPHRDADLCSASMRALFPPLIPWTVRFKDPTYPGGVESMVGPHGVDCGANGFVFNDGGIKS